MAVQSFNHWPQVADRLHKALARTVKKVAIDMVKDAKDFAPVDTGFLRDSIYATGAWGSDYGEATAHTMLSKKRKSQFKTQAYLTRDVFPEVAHSGDDLTAYVVVGASYGVYLEYGTRYQPAQPYFNPALRVAQVHLDGLLALVEAQIKGGIVSGTIEDMSV